jgi:hypothetical protein
MPKARKKRPPYDPPLKQVLAWADAHHERTGEWPGVLSGPVKDNLNENWRKKDNSGAFREPHRWLKCSTLVEAFPIG